MSHPAKRLISLAAIAALAIGACSASTTPAPSAGAPSVAAPSTGASTAPSTAGSAAASPTAACPAPPTGAITLQGAGATFPNPLYQVLVRDLHAKYTNIQIDYQAIGSGGGITQITQQTVDFGASDAAMKDEEIAALPPGTKILHFPTALGAVVVIYNLPGVAKLQLDCANIAGIFLGNDHQVERPDDRRATTRA